MIGVSSSSRDFAALAAYLARGRGDDEPERVAWTASRHLPTDDPDVAATMMHASAARNARVVKPVYHLAISFDPGDRVDRSAMEHVADRILGALGLSEHQALIIAHQDRQHPHLHLMINRVHPDTGRAWSRWQDQRVVQRILREEELALGLRRVPGRLAATPQLDAFERGPNADAERRSSFASPGAERIRDDEVARSMQEVERAVAARREHLASHLAVEAARARLGELDTAMRRAARADAEFRRALAALYRDPESAKHALYSEIRRVGIAESLAHLVREPERFGALLSARQRWWGILSRDDRDPARRAAPYVAAKARDAFEAERAARGLASASHVRAAQGQFRRALANVYRDPNAAERAFENLARTQGGAHAVHVLGAEPNRLGTMRSGLAPNGGAGPFAAGAMIAGRHFLSVEAAARTGEPVESRGAFDSMTKALAAARSDVERALVERTGTGVSAGVLRAQTRHPYLRRTIARLLPTELTRLSLAWSKPARALVAKVRRSIRDAILERDREPG